MIQIIKKNYLFIIIFIFAFIINYLLIGHYYDAITQFGMSRAISNGEIPYNDFSIISTPLYVFIHGFFLIFWDSYIMFSIINSIIFALTCYYINKIIPGHFLTYFLIILFPLFDVLCPSYNLLAKLLVIIVIYLEKEKKSDLLIGLVLGLLLMSKHSIGIPIIIFSFLYIKKFSKIKYRLIGILIPTLVFLIYLLITKSLYNFIDLSLLGLFDFNEKNHVNNPRLIVFSIFMLGYYIYLLIKHKKEDNYLVYYALGSLSFLIPIIDLNHFTGPFLMFLLIIFTRYDIKLYYWILNIFLAIIVCLSGTYLVVNTYKPIEIKSYNHFPFYISRVNDKRDDILNAYDKKYPNSIMFSSRGDFYDIVCDRKFSYFDVPLTGNYGHRGMNKLIDLMKDDTYYFVNKDCGYLSIGQYDRKMCRYIKNHSTYVDTIDIFDIYYYKKKRR